MAETYISCNLASCRKKLHHSAFVTTCKHIFCLKHMQGVSPGAKENRHTCLACGNQLQNEFDVVQVNLNPNEQYKAMVLIGLNPEQIMETATRAINFFIYQINYDKRIKEDAIHNLNEQNSKLKSNYASIITKCESEINHHLRNVERAKYEIKEKMREIELQQQEIAEYKKKLKQLQLKNDSYKDKLRCPPPVIPSHSPPRRNNFYNYPLNNQQPYAETIATSHLFPFFNNNINYKNQTLFDESG